MKKTIVIILEVLMLASCSTLRQSQKKLLYVEMYHKELLTNYCADNFPAKPDTQYVRGKEIVKTDTTKIYFNCDSALSDYKVKNPQATRVEAKAAMQKVYVPTVLRDTLRRTDTLKIKVENTARVAQLADLNTALATKLEAAEKAKTTWKWLFIGICAVLAAGIYWGMKK